MLDSVKISRRQSEIRAALAALVGKEKPTDDEVRSMAELDKEYTSNETRYRAALIAEDDERKKAKGEFETRGDREWLELIGQFQVCQVALALDEGRALDGATAEVVQELRSRGRGRAGAIPVPWAALALERRAGETVASGVPDPVRTMDIVDRLFPDSIAAAMGCQMITIDHGELEYPVTTQGATVGWQATETGAVGSAQAFQTTDRPLKPDYTLGAQMKITRRSLKQSGAGLEMAVRRDMNSAISEAIDDAAFNGTGSSGQPLGIVFGAATYGINADDVGPASTWADFRGAVARFMTANAGGPSGINLAFTPTIWDTLDGQLFDAGSGITELDRLMKFIPNPVISNQLTAGTALLTVSKNGVPPFVCGMWGSIDIIRDVYTQAASGMLLLTALATVDFAVLRPAQIEILTDLGS